MKTAVARKEAVGLPPFRSAKSEGTGGDDGEVSTLRHVTGGVTWRKPGIIDLTYIYIILRKDSERALPTTR